LPQSMVYRTGRARVAFNMTPMIDCTFQLIIFFILTTQLASQEYVRIELPKPDRNVAREYELNKVVVNVVPHAKADIDEDETLRGVAKEYRISVDRFDRKDIDALVARLIQVQRQNKASRAGEAEAGSNGFTVELRADKGIHFQQIEPVLQALQEAKLGRMYITAVRGEGT
jgi:biopolymer transport protein ExbD